MYSQASRTVKGKTKRQRFSNYDSISGRQPSIAYWTPSEIESLVGTISDLQTYQVEQQQSHDKRVMQPRGSLRIRLYYFQWSIDAAGILQVSHDTILS